jgi:hypothetical protein
VSACSDMGWGRRARRTGVDWAGVVAVSLPPTHPARGCPLGKHRWPRPLLAEGAAWHHHLRFQVSQAAAGMAHVTTLWAPRLEFCC